MELTLQQRNLVKELYVKAIEYNCNNFTVFSYLSGHVDWLTIDVHYGGYHQNGNKTTLGCVRFDDADGLSESLTNLIAKLDAAKAHNIEKLKIDLDNHTKIELDQLARLKAKYEGQEVNV